MNKQPQTCYVHTDEHYHLHIFDSNKDGCDLDPRTYVNELTSVYIHTPEELEALKAEWQREAVENTIKWVLSNMDFEDIGAHVPLYDYLDQHYPKPQPLNTNI